MRHDWLFDRYPEIAHLPRSQQQALVTAAAWKFRKDRRTWLLFLPLSLMPLAGIFIAQRVPLPAQLHVAYWVAWCVLLCAGHGAQARVRYHVVHDALRASLLQKGIRPACCFECGYDLRSIEGDRCPECGAPLRNV